MTSADHQVVARHLADLRRCLTQLKRHSGRPASALLDVDEQWAVERGLQLCAQNAIDIATHLATALGAEPANYADAFDALARLGVLPAEFVARFRTVAGFRNVLVHAYLAIDARVVHEAVNGGLGEFDAFAAHVEAWLARSESPPPGS